MEEVVVINSGADICVFEATKFVLALSGVLLEEDVFGDEVCGEEVVDEAEVVRMDG